jgi:hypothetical protein
MHIWFSTKSLDLKLFFFFFGFVLFWSYRLILKLIFSLYLKECEFFSNNKVWISIIYYILANKSMKTVVDHLSGTVISSYNIGSWMNSSKFWWERTFLVVLLTSCDKNNPFEISFIKTIFKNWETPCTCIIYKFVASLWSCLVSIFYKKVIDALREKHYWYNNFH